MVTKWRIYLKQFCCDPSTSRPYTHERTYRHTPPITIGEKATLHFTKINPYYMKWLGIDYTVTFTEIVSDTTLVDVLIHSQLARRALLKFWQYARSRRPPAVTSRLVRRFITFSAIATQYGDHVSRTARDSPRIRIKVIPSLADRTNQTSCVVLIVTRIESTMSLRNF